MNYYPHHIGDYSSATAHLTMLEDCVYRRLLDWYYLDEKLIPLERRTVYRRIRASAEAEREAVDVVIEEFFSRTDEGYRHARCDEEIERSRIKSDERREAANKRWAGKQGTTVQGGQGKDDAKAPTADAKASSDDAKAMHSQEPITNNQEPKEEKKDSGQAAAPIPPGFVAFWMDYPNTGRKVDKADCLKHWRKERLEAKAPEILAHVACMKDTEQWLSGYEPAPLTYLRKRRYDDPIPECRPRPQQQAPPPAQGKYSATIAGLTGRTRQPEIIDVTEHFPRRLVSPPV